MRTPPPTAPPVAERVAHIADLMATGKYQTRVTVRRLAAEWGVTEGTLGNDAAEAMRMLAVPESEKAARRAAMAAWFEQQAHEASDRLNSITGLPDTAAALKAMELYGKYAGLEPTDDETKKPTQGLTVRLVVEGDDSKKEEG